MAEEQEFKPNSFNTMMGRVLERLELGDKTMQALTATTEKLNTTINCLPCVSHEEKIKAIQDDKNNRRSFWNDIKAIIISCVLTAILSVGTTLLIVH
jgi:hypothetical protein